MDKHIEAIQDKQLQETIKNLNARGFVTYVCDHKGEVLKQLNTLICDHSVVACGGSMTLQEVGVLDYLKQRNLNFLDRYKAGLSEAQYQKCMQDAFGADTYLMSTSAITRDGCLYNIDGNGNRLACLLFGPKQVIIIVGINKLCENVDDAVLRLQNVSAPANAHRLGCLTPCVKLGRCMDCRSVDRICAQHVVTTWQHTPKRIKIIFVKETLGY